ncbi:MAG: hypothetical protein WCX48_11555 [Bacteroidales bacterium]
MSACFAAPEKHEIKWRQEKPASLRLCACNKNLSGLSAPENYAVYDRLGSEQLRMKSEKCVKDDGVKN